MRSILFAMTSPMECRKLAPTIDVEYIPIKLMENMKVNLWDCGGQQNMMLNYFKNRRESIFSQVNALVYVFDVSTDGDEEVLRDFHESLQALGENSSNTKVFCLLHKTDVLIPSEREKILQRKEKEIMAVAELTDLTCFRTSIWDESLYRAWGSILNTLIPQINEIKSKLEEFAKICGAEEVVLFERSTFLLISQWSNEKVTQDDHRFEKIANITKQFKLSCSKAHSQLSSMELVKSDFSAFFEEFTMNTFIMVIVSAESKLESEMVKMNIRLGRKLFNDSKLHNVL